MEPETHRFFAFQKLFGCADDLAMGGATQVMTYVAVVLVLWVLPSTAIVWMLTHFVRDMFRYSKADWAVAGQSRTLMIVALFVLNAFGIYIYRERVRPRLREAAAARAASA